MARKYVADLTHERLLFRAAAHVLPKIATTTAALHERALPQHGARLAFQWLEFHALVTDWIGHNPEYIEKPSTISVLAMRK